MNREQDPVLVGRRVLVIEDDPSQAELIATLLRRAGCEVQTAATGMAGLARARAGLFDVLLVDFNLPDLSGLEVVTAVRQASDVPVLLVTARCRTGDKVECLDAGADDYITKPFAPSELLARVRAVLRRAANRSGDEATYTVGDLCIDAARRRVTRGKDLLGLSPREFDLLRTLAAASGRVLSRRDLFARVWGPDFVGDRGALDVYMRRLRAKIEPDPARPRYLHTLRGAGFRLALSDEADPPAAIAA